MLIFVYLALHRNMVKSYNKPNIKNNEQQL